MKVIYNEKRMSKNKITIESQMKAKKKTASSRDRKSRKMMRELFGCSYTTVGAVAEAAAAAPRSPSSSS